jgi:hypothetical protein
MSLKEFLTQREAERKAESHKLICNHLVYSLHKVTQMLTLIGLKMKGQGNPHEIIDTYAEHSERLTRTVSTIESIMTQEGMLTEDFDIERIDKEEDLMDATTDSDSEN